MESGAAAEKCRTRLVGFAHGSTGGVAAAVRLLEAGVAALSEVDLEALSDGEQLALVRVVHPLVRSAAG